MADDWVFRALADPTRREILDALFEREGQSLSELEGLFDMTRFGVMKHVKVLEEAGLVVTRKVGRSRLHYLNPVPIREIHDRWTGKFAARASGALLAFTLSLDEFVITFFTGGPGSTTLPILVWSMLKRGVTPEVNALSTLLLLVSIALVTISVVLQRRR